MEGELSILKANVDSCDNLIADYKYELSKCRNIYATYDKLLQEKNVVIDLDGQEIKLMKREARILKTKLIATGIALPLAAGGSGVVFTFLVMSLKK
jgi:hypothetical protein